MNLAPPPNRKSLASVVADMSKHERDIFLMQFTPAELKMLEYDWGFWGRPEQQEPEGAWAVWLVLAGRGFGKTRLGSEWVRKMMCGPTPLAAGRVAHMALVAENAADARDVMIQSAAGILRVHNSDFRPKYNSSLRKLTWPNGAIAHTYSADDPEQLRGPEHDAAWSDELAKWRYAEETWDMLQFGLRAGSDPRQLVTTTPRPIQILRDLVSSPETVITKGSTYDNAANLAPQFLATMRARYEGTRLGRQELRAEILDDVVGALWTREMLDRRTARHPLGAGMSINDPLPPMRRVVVGVDPSGTTGEDDAARRRRKDGKEEEAGDDVGIVCCGLGVDNIVYVLEDGTCNFPPSEWAKRVVQVFDRQEADMVVGEMNFGGAMVEYTIRTARRNIPYRAVHASRGKVVRAQPIASLYEQGKVRHVGTFGALEDQMVSMTQRGYEGRGSPDRVDALVWAITDLVFGISMRGGISTISGHH